MAIYKKVSESRLPNTYQEVEYIESTGTQYIDCGFAPSNNTNIEMKYQYSTLDGESTQYRVFGSRGDGSTDRAFFIGKNDNDWFINYNDGSNYAQGITWGNIDTNIHIVKNKGSAFYFDGVNVITFATGTFTSPYNAILFGGNSKGTIFASKTRVYYCKVWNDSTLIRNFIPCYRKNDDVIGLYDTVNGVFYTNQGTGTFLKGNDVSVMKKVVGLYKGSTKIVKRYKGTSLIYSASRLPSAYQEVEYIESSGTQYINSLVSPTVNTGIKVKYAYTEISSDASAGVCGTYQSVSPRTDTLFVTTNSGKTNTYLLVLHRGASINNYSDVPVVDQKYNAEINYYNSEKLVLNNQTSIQGTNGVETYNLIIFARYNKQNGNISVSKSRIYEFKVTELNSLIRDFIPCYRKSDNVVGMYDLVNDVFYTNAGTGTFIKGNDV